MSQLDKFSKKWGTSINRTKKENRKAAEGHMLKEMADKKLANETVEETMIRTGVTNFETGEVVDYKTAYADDNVWGFMNKSFYNKLIEDTKLQTQEKVEAEMMEQFKAMLNEVLDARESNKRKEEIALAELRIRELELQVELAKLKSSNEVVEYELTSMIPASHGKLEEVIKEHSKAVDTILDAVEIVEKPKRKKRSAKINKVEEVIEIVDGPSTPLRNTQGRMSIAWNKVIADDKLIDTLYHVVLFAADNGVDVRKSTDFKSFSPLCNGAYQQFGRIYKGRGAWSAQMMEFGF